MVEPGILSREIAAMGQRMNTYGTAAILAGIVGVAQGQVTPEPTGKPGQPRTQGEQVDQLPGDKPVRTGPSGLFPAGPFMSIQANVDGNGNNVIGDAANEPSIGVDPLAPNRIVVGWRQFDTINSNFREAGFSSSIDGGRTWSGMGEIESGIFRSDPVVKFDDEGNAYYASLTITNQNEFLNDTFISTDGGQTWPTKSFAFGGDKLWFAIDDFTHNGPAKIYQGWNIAGNEFFPNQFNRSLDGGFTFTQPTEYDPGTSRQPTFGQVAVGPDGAVYVVGGWNGGPGDILWIARSDDAQDPNVNTPTFSIATIDLSGGAGFAFFGGNGSPNPQGLLAQANISVDPSSGDVIVVVPTFGIFSGGSVNVTMFKSTDRGDTWGAPVRCNDETSGVWNWFGTMSCAPNGRIDVVLNSNRDNPNSARQNKSYYTFSADGGQTWSDDQEISPQWDSHIGWPQQNKIGDYYDMISDAVGAHLIYATTLNGEQDLYYMRINDYDCDGNGVGDGDDIDNGDAQDCNANGIPDLCEIAAGAVEDTNGDGVPDACETCVADLDCDGDSDADDFFAFLDLFAADDPDADLDADGDTDADDFFLFLDLFVAC